ncbi:hypothetical protein CONLIGDRAFT_690811 [Coniochaeta ligniaria NRRL 30616]|uniref:DNA2/NAM7 helicase-like C-terminal domain-containing protein n=1 Tax=Coniochaeta ligniaria NRRL 30616 TaxID=1408157 RepID=A0A1J7IC98_9PEZI|nr:hypothetical protein CONLIGDRAFT_690811 [Coniochaeta ligniaria NRRL 30616]
MAENFYIPRNHAEWEKQISRPPLGKHDLPIGGPGRAREVPPVTAPPRPLGNHSVPRRGGPVGDVRLELGRSLMASISSRLLVKACDTELMLRSHFESYCRPAHLGLSRSPCRPAMIWITAILTFVGLADRSTVCNTPCGAVLATCRNPLNNEICTLGAGAGIGGVSSVVKEFADSSDPQKTVKQMNHLASDIGIITPYSAMNAKLRRQLGLRPDLKGVMVTTTDSMQGQEAAIIFYVFVVNGRVSVGHVANRYYSLVLS